jgi:hypothetical protein
MTWIYKDKEITEPIEGMQGYVYLLTLPNGIKYVGKKTWWFKAYKQVNKKRKSYKKQSDWLDYYGSSDYIKSLIKSDKQNELTREIIDVAFDKKHLTYLETKYLFMCGVLEKPEEWINDNIQGRFFTKDFTELNQIKNLEKQAKDFVFEYGKIKIQ